MTHRLDRLYATVAFLTASAALFRTEYGYVFHAEGSSNATWTSIPCTLAAVAVLLRPSDPRLLLVLFATIVLDVAHVLPMSTNHWLLTSLVGATWLLAAAARMWAGRWSASGGEWLGDVLVPLRVGVATFYFFTGLWKLNDGFISLEHSCGVSSWGRLVAQFPFLPDGPVVGHGVVAFTLVVELLGPVLLLVPRTRPWAVVAFTLFHAVLGLDIVQNYQNFSWAMFPLLLLFVEPEQLDRAVQRAPNVVARFPVARAAFAVSWLVVIAAAVTDVSLFLRLRWVLSAATAWLWLAALVVVVVPPVRAGQAPPARAVSWVFVALVVLNGLSPVIGLKTHTSWQMYSNLRIEPTTSNHWLFPRSLDLFGWQSDTARILRSSDPTLQALADDGLHIVWVDLRRHAAAHAPLSVTYERRGVIREVPDAAADAELSRPPLLWRKLAWFHPVGPGAGDRCVW